MRFWTILTAALVVIAAQFAATAEARDQFNQKDAVSINPQKSYIFFRTRQKMELQFLREVTPEEHAAWVTARSAALVRAQEHYERQSSEYRRAVETCRNVPPPCLTMERPVPVTDETFAFAPAESDNFVSVRRGPQFSRTGEDDYTYLVAVPPGTYALYGPVTVTGNGAVGFCLCMGSVRFEARPGQVMDLGEVRYPASEGLRAQGQSAAAHTSSVQVVPWDPAMARPDRLNGLPVMAAEWRAAEKMPNYFGVLIDRHPAVPGLLRYQRDRVIDDRTGADPVSLIEAGAGGTGG